MKKVPKVLALHDLTGVGRCALSLIFPIMAAFKVQICPVATAMLSTHPACFGGDYYMKDTTESMKKILEHYKQLGIGFDCIYTGFLGNSSQVALIGDYIASIPKEKRGMVVIDPVFADNGEIYETQSADIVERMREFIRHGDLITPNITEAAYLIGEKPKDIYDEKTVRDYLTALTALGPKSAVITGVLLKERPGEVCVCGYNGAEFSFAHTPITEGEFHGTGDTFASVLIGGLSRGKAMEKAMQMAADFVRDCANYVKENNIPLVEGLPVEALIDTLLD